MGLAFLSFGCTTGFPGLDPLQQDQCRLIGRVLRNELAFEGTLQDALAEGFGLEEACDDGGLYFICDREKAFNLIYRYVLFIFWGDCNRCSTNII